MVYKEKWTWRQIHNMCYKTEKYQTNERKHSCTKDVLLKNAICKGGEVNREMWHTQTVLCRFFCVVSLISVCVCVCVCTNVFTVTVHWMWSQSNFELCSQTFLICENKMPTRCTDDIYCRFYCMLNMFQAILCPSSGARACSLQTRHITFSSTQYRQPENQSTKYHRQRPSV